MNMEEIVKERAVVPVVAGGKVDKEYKGLRLREL
jgi:hypothetical protein